MDFDAEFAALLAHPLTKSAEMDQHLISYRPRYTHIVSSVRKWLPNPQGPAVDVGCGYGVTLWLLRNLGFTELIGVDLFTRKADSFLADIDRTRLIRGNLETPTALAEIPDNSCACVMSSQVLEHLFSHPFHHLEECFRVLRPGGLFLLDIPNPNTLANAARMVSGRFGIWGDLDFAMQPKVLPGGELTTTWSIHYREYPPSVLRLLVEKLPGSRILQAGFVATAAAPSDPLRKRFVKRALQMVGLANRRLFANVQWLAITKN